MVKTPGGRGDRIRALELAERFVRGGKIQDAIAQYEKILSIDPEDSATYNIIGDLYFQIGQKEKSSAALMRAAEEYEKRGMSAQALGVFKKIYKLAPDNPENCLKLAELYAREGYVADAKTVFMTAVSAYEDRNEYEGAARILDKVVGLDREDIETRKRLAEVYRRLKNKDLCLDQLDGIAEIMIERGDTKGAGEVLKEALSIDPADSRAVSCMVELFKRDDKPDKAVKFVEERLKAAPNDAHLLNLLGNMLFDKGETEKAGKIFAEILGGHPQNVNARMKLGRIQIVREKYDEAFELFIPLIDSLIKKHKDEKAIGLLGLILEADKTHLPSLDRLASIYRTNRELNKLEVVDKVIVKELRARGEADRMLTVLGELCEISPEDKDIEGEYKSLSKSLGIIQETKPRESAGGLNEHDQAVIRETLDQADMYLQQGLVRNARRILENLKLRFPDETQILKKIAVINQIKTHIDEEELRRRIEKTSLLEMKYKESGGAEKRSMDFRKQWGPFSRDIMEGEKVSTAEIFAETDIIPFMPGSGEQIEFKVYDLEDQIKDEQRMLRMSYRRQIQGEMAQYERDLTNIVEDFKKDLKTKVRAEDYETHFNLGLAFMEQGLFNEAIDEFSTAAKDKKLAVDCFSLISYCHKQGRSFGDAREWLDRALKMVREGTEQYYALSYDLAELFENVNDADQATKIFQEIIAWNPHYRNISRKMEHFGAKADVRES